MGLFWKERKGEHRFMTLFFNDYDMYRILWSVFVSMLVQRTRGLGFGFLFTQLDTFLLNLEIYIHRWLLLEA